MTTRHSGGREAISHYKVASRLDSPFGKFSLIEVKIDTGRTHQIRVHMASLGHPVVGDALYGAARELRSKPARAIQAPPRTMALPRNFLHAAELDFTHPRSGAKLVLTSPLPVELQKFLRALEDPGTI
jgi:23S rRNA pseudouridine1911/1915/1917 synthase